MVRFIPLLAVLALWLPASTATAQNFQGDVAKAQKTLDDINKLIDGMGGSAGGPTRAAVAAQPAGAPAPARRQGGANAQPAGPQVVQVDVRDL